MEQQHSLNDLLVKGIDPAARQRIELVVGALLSDDERMSAGLIQWARRVENLTVS